MAKHLKLTIKNTQIAEAINLGGLKDKLAKKKAGTAGEPQKEVPPPKSKPTAKSETDTAVKSKEESPRIRARSKSVFAESPTPTHPQRDAEISSTEEESLQAPSTAEETEIVQESPKTKSKARDKKKSSEELRRDIFGEEAVAQVREKETEEIAEETGEQPISEQEVSQEKITTKQEPIETLEAPKPPPTLHKPTAPLPSKELPKEELVKREKEKLGPTGRHVKDLIPPPKARPAKVEEKKTEVKRPAEDEDSDAYRGKQKVRIRGEFAEEVPARKGVKAAPTKEFRDVKPRRQDGQRTFDARDRQGLRVSDEDQRWRKKRKPGRQMQEEMPVVRPTTLSIRTPISIKDLASEMKLKASQLISKLFLQGIIVTLNDLLEDETTILLLGQEFGCEITIDTSEERRIQITDKSVKEEIRSSPEEERTIRPPVVAFMGHVDHGKTSLIDSIRKSNRAAGEAGAITQHIGAFRCHTPVGDIAILDTPGHEAFSAMRARGADVTDIVVLVVAGDEGIRQQTLEAIQHAKDANVTIVVALNKSDKPGFNPDNVYRQLADQELLPEVWGGQTLTVNCSAVTGEGIQTLLETLALQAEVLELKANPHMRARGTVLESEMHKGLGVVATVLVQNGTLRLGDSLVFEQLWGRVKTMRDEFGRDILEATPSTPVSITGMSGLPSAGQEFIVVKNEREAREIGEARRLGYRQSNLQQKKALTIENLLQQATPTQKKILNVVIRADVQGSLEALKVALEKIESTKAELNIIFTGVGEVSESDIQLASTSKALVIGFHTRIESHADSLIKQLGVQVRLHDIIYHAIDDVKAVMTSLLDKIPQEIDRGKAEIRALFKSSHAGLIAGCMVIDGTIQRNYNIRVLRNGEFVGKAQISSLKRVKEDAKEVGKGLECGIALGRFTDLQVGDILEAYEITYITQEL